MAGNEKKKRSRDLFTRFLNDAESPTERKALLRWLHQYRADETVELDEQEIDKAVATSRTRIMAPTAAPTRNLRSRYWFAAAAVALIVSSFSYFYSNRTEVVENWGGPQKASVVEEPNWAVLNLENGKTVDLSKLDTGLISENEQYSLYLDSEGFLQYHYKEKTNLSEEAITWHELKIPEKEQFKIRLADGTEVWMNASSTLRYPSRFAADKREVFLEGEAFFKVTKGAAAFIVDTKPQVIQVLGTSFNVEAYADVDVAKTSLIEGKVQVTGQTDSDFAVDLSPGYQLITTAGKQASVRKMSPMDNVGAWRDGDIYFTDDSLPEAMKKIERAYGVRMKYKSKLNGQRVSGVVSKTQSLETVLRTLEKITGLKLVLKGEDVLIED